MEYFITFLEGIITFISPCLLPMLPIYLSYFAGGIGEEAGSRPHTVKNALGFILGFSIVFMAMGFFAGTLGSWLIRGQTVVNVVAGAIVILFGLNYLGVIQIGFLNRTVRLGESVHTGGFFSAVVFGIVFSIGWTPCVGAFLGSALTMAAMGAEKTKGLLLLLCFSLGLGVPFLISAVLIDQLKGAFDFIKRNYRVINAISGLFLVGVGIMMATGYLGRLLTILSV